MKNKFRSLSIFSLALILVFSAIGFIPVIPVRAAALVVNSLNDVDDGTCNGTHCSLREAINEANGLGSDDTITFSVAGTIHLASTLPQVTGTDKLTINGGSAITVSGDTDNNTTADVQIMTVHSSADLTLQNITLTRGKEDTIGGGAIHTAGDVTLQNSLVSDSTSSAPSGGGGAVRIEGGSATLTVTDSDFTGNSVDDFGGAIFNVGGTATITGGAFSGNSAGGAGGGIANSGSLTVINSVFSTNSSPTGGGGAISNLPGNSEPVTITASAFSSNDAEFGGAFSSSSGSTTISDSTFTGNDASVDGGGLYIAASGLLTLTNSTLSANTSLSRGGGLFTFGNVTMTNSTLSDNTALAGYGGGFYNFAVWIAKNNLLANNGVGGDCVLDGSGSVSGTSSNNLIEDASTACGLTNGTNGNVIGSDPLLGPLQNNGGTTDTHDLLSGSPAIDKGTNTGCPAADQRGDARPNGATCDIGAVESQLTTLTYRSISTNDGWVLESGETTNVGGSTDSASTTFNLGDNAQNKQYKSIISFNTASLPDTAVITRVTLQILRNATVGTDPYTMLGALWVDIRKPYFGAAGTLGTDDFAAAASQNSIGHIPNTPVANVYSKVWTVDTFFSNINLTGSTQFRLRFATDDDNDLGADYFKFYSGNHAFVTYRPTLIIEYYVP